MWWPNLRTVAAMRSQRSVINVEVTWVNDAVHSALWDSNRLRLHTNWTHFDWISVLFWNTPEWTRNHSRVFIWHVMTEEGNVDRQQMS